MRKALRTIFVVAILVITTAVLSGLAFAGGPGTRNNASPNGNAGGTGGTGQVNGTKNSTKHQCADPWWC